MGFPRGVVIKNPPADAGAESSLPLAGSSPGEGNDNLLQYSCLENPTDSRAWWATVHGVEKSDTTYQLNNMSILFPQNWKKKQSLQFKTKESQSSP